MPPPIGLTVEQQRALTTLQELDDQQILEWLAYVRSFEQKSEPVSTIQLTVMPETKSRKSLNPTSILSIAPELHLNIAEYLYEESVMLKLTNRYFYRTIKPLTYSQACELRWTLHKPRWSACGACCRLRREEEFSTPGDSNVCIECKVKQKHQGFGLGGKIKLGHDGNVFHYDLNGLLWEFARENVICRNCNEFRIRDRPRRIQGLCKKCWDHFSYEFMEVHKVKYRSRAEEMKRGVEVDPRPADYHRTIKKEHLSKLKTSSAGWLHHAISCYGCKLRFDRCLRADAHKFGDWATPTIVAD